MRRYISIFLALVMCLSIAACGKSEEELKLESVTISNYTKLPTSESEFLSAFIDNYDKQPSTLADMFHVVLMGNSDFDIESLNPNNMCIGKNIAENRIDVISAYDNGILHVRHYCDSLTTEYGTRKSDLSTTEYITIMQELGIIDEYKTIP